MGDLAGKLDGITSGNGSKLDLILDRLEGDDREALLRALADEDRASAANISAQLRAAGHDIGATAVKTWRVSHRTQK